VITHAAAIAEKLQGAHERRTRGQDMSKDESVWRDDDRIDKLAEEVARLAEQLREATNAPRIEAPQASAVSPERVVELERERTELRNNVVQANARVAELKKQLIELERKLMDALSRAKTAEVDAKAVTELLATAYVVREVTWSNVAAGMMTISKEEHPRPWMVESWDANGETATLRNGETTFPKTPTPGETVRVLVPYVTDAQAEATLRAAGATEVS
jgi:hypothetical protein